mmetsp:Transcript_5107/g.9735  ORF Transcript_5107/g.9735 Transcript_5107/m.9735 type:complete len:595 (+) Transcript_5107:2-1786(+)
MDVGSRRARSFSLLLLLSAALFISMRTFSRFKPLASRSALGSSLARRPQSPLRSPRSLVDAKRGMSFFQDPLAPRRGRFCRSSSSRVGDTGFRPSPQSPLSQGLAGVVTDEGFQKLVRDVLGIAGEVGLERGLQRSILGARAALKFGAEIAANPDEYIDEKTRLPSGPKVLRGLFERLGATYVKLGQFIASSPTLFPEEYVLEFQKCLDKTPTTSFATIERIVTEDLGRPISEVYSQFDKVPLASASVAQVHKAILRSTGEQVAVKVRKPGVEAALSADLGFILAAAKVVEYLNPSLTGVPLAGIVEDLREAMIGELDFTKEASNLKKFKNFLLSNQITTVTCPEVVDSASSTKVLTMEYLDGVPLVDLDGIRKYSSDPEATLVSALNAWTLSVIANDFFHADVHAGNLLVLKDGRVGFIDFGIVGTIPPKIWDALQELTRAFAEGDSEGMAGALVMMGATNEKVDVAKFGNDIERIISKINEIDQELVVVSDGMSASAQIAVDQEQVSRLLIDIVQVAENNGVRLPREFGLLVKQALYFDRYTKLLAPQLDVMNDDRIRWSQDGRVSYQQRQSIPRRNGPTYDDGDVIDVEPL